MWKLRCRLVVTVAVQADVVILVLCVRASAGDSGAATHICLAGEQCGATLLPTKSGGGGPPTYSHGVGGYFGLYGTGQFDGQVSFLHTRPCLLDETKLNGFSCSLFRFRPLFPPSLSPICLFLFPELRPRLHGHCVHAFHRQHQQLRWWPLAHVLRLPPAVRRVAISGTASVRF